MSGGDDVRGERSADDGMQRVECSRVCVRAAATLVAIALTFLGSRRAGAQTAPHIHLKGRAHVDVQVAREPGRLLLSGTVQDDTNRPVPRAKIRATFAVASQAPARIHLAPADAQACDGFDVSPGTDSSGDAVATSDDRARFCIRVALATDRYAVHVETPGSELLDGAATDVTVDLSLPLVALRFDPEPVVLSLDDESTSVEVIASIDGEPNTPAARAGTVARVAVVPRLAGLALSLSDERGSLLANALTDGSGLARFDIDARRLGSPGRGDLRVRFGGSERAGAAMRTTSVERRTRVDVIAPDARGGRLPAGSPEDGIPIDIVARPRCERHGCRASPTGIIEAYAGGSAIVGAAPLDRSGAHLLVQFGTPAEALANPNGDEVPISMRYVPNDPCFLPGADITLVQPVRGRNVWSRVASVGPLFLAGAMVLALLAFGRLPFRALNRRPRDARPPVRDTGGRVQLVRGAPASQGWTGQVADAHDGKRIEHARLAIERPGFERSAVLAEAVSDGMGIFALPFVEARPGDQLVAGGRLHAGLRRPLPPSGELAIMLVLRKRALLDRLIAWARRQGAPYDHPPDPTPGHVRRSAGSDVDVARWATAVEQAVYGGDVIDEGAHAKVERLAPPE